MRAVIGALFLLASCRLGDSLPERQGLAPACGACSTVFVTVTADGPGAKSSTTPPHVVPTATVTIDSFGVPMHGHSSGDEKSGSSSLAPLGHCGPAPSSEAVPETQDACHAPGHANPKTTSKTSSSSANECGQGSRGSTAVPTPGSGSQVSGPVLPTGSSSPLSSTQLVTETSSPSVSLSNITSGAGVFSTGTAPGSSPFPSPVISQTGTSGSSSAPDSSVSSMGSQIGASGSAGPIYVNATGTSDKSWADGTSVPGNSGTSRTVSAPSGFTTSGVSGSSTGSLPSSRNSSQTPSAPSGFTPSGVAPSRFTPSGVTAGPTASIPGNWNSSQTVIPSGLAPSGVTVGPTGSFPGSWNSSQTVSAPPDFTTSGGIGPPTGSLPGSRNASQTVTAPSNVIPSSFIPSGSTGTPTGPLPGSRNASEAITGSFSVIPSGFTTISTEPTSHTSLESPPREGNNPSSSEGASDASASLPIPSTSTPASDSTSGQGSAESSSPAAGESPSSPYDPRHQVLRRATPPFFQQGVVQDLLALFTFPENTNSLYKRLWQSAQELPVADPGYYASASFTGNQTTSSLSPTEVPSVVYTCACPIPETTAQGVSVTSSSSSSLATGVSATSQGVNMTTSFGTAISTTSSSMTTASTSFATGSFITSSPGANMSTSIGATGASITPSPSANISTSFAATGVSVTSSPGASITPSSSANISTSSATEDIPVTSLPGANMTTPIGTTAASATPSPSANTITPPGTTGVSSIPSPNANMSTSVGTAYSSIASSEDTSVGTPLTGAPSFTNSTSAAIPTPTGAPQESSFGSTPAASSILTAPTPAFTSASSVNVSYTASSVPPMATSPSPSASLTASAPSSKTTGTAGSSSTAICDSASSVGNETINFDDMPPGQLFNPYHNFWFSEGFVVTQDSESPYRSSSGNQLAEFIPASLSNGRFNNSSHDLAMISVGRQGSNPCFRFNLYSISLGCPPNLPEPLCEFSIWGMRYNEATHHEEGTGTDEDVHTLKCDQARCDLSLTEFNTYKNITSFIVKATSGNETQPWWADDLVLGWTDNSCEAAECRERAVNMTGRPEHGRRLRL